MKNCFLSVRILALALVIALMSTCSFSYTDSYTNNKIEQKEHDFVNSLNQEANKTVHNTPQFYQESMLNLLKGITVLKHLYAQAKASSDNQYPIGSTYLGLALNPDNAREILDTMAIQMTKKLEEYENYLLKLKKEIDSSSPEQPLVASKLEKTLKFLWFDYANRASVESIKSAQSSATGRGMMLAALFSAMVPLACNILVGFNNSAESMRLNVMAFIVVTAAGSLGGFLGYFSSDSTSNPEEHQLESVAALLDQLEMVVTAEELFNGALVDQHRRELLRKKSSPDANLLPSY